ncbi:MAG: hypothetical protein AB7U73_14300 [Pirellulales bacterium]
MQFFAMTSLLIAAAAVPIDTPKVFPFLAGLAIPPDRLPAGCTIAELPKNFLGVEGFENQWVSTDPRLFAMGDERLPKLLDPTKIEAVYFGIYRERNDVGVIGWAFHSAADAKAAHARLSESYKQEPERMRFWRSGRHVVWLWRDPGTSDACYAALARFVEERVDAAGKK